jgi:hypothetical protein
MMVPFFRPTATHKTHDDACSSACEAEHARLRARMVELVNENLKMHEELRRASEAMSQHRQSTSRIVSSRCIEECADVFEQNADLVNLYVASARLHESVARHEVLLAIQEIVINLIGSEQIAVLELDEDGRTLSLVSAFGIEESRYASVPVGVGIIGRVALSGEPYLTGGRTEDDAPPSREEPSVTACVPLKLFGRVQGVLVVFQLLRQKPALRELDHRLLEIVSTQAAPALYCARALEP